jgi:hypothetical protein
MRILLMPAVLAIWCASLLAAEPPSPEPAPPTKESAAGAQETSPPPKERVMKALRTTAEALRSRSLEPEERAAFVELLGAAEALRTDESVPQHERDRLRGLARVRLGEGANVLRRTAARPADENVSRQFPAAAGAAGPQQQLPDVVEAEKLIEIITGAIRPESWDVNGGLGTIRYWSLGNALIITNTAEVHERVGGLTGALRP